MQRTLEMKKETLVSRRIGSLKSSLGAQTTASRLVKGWPVNRGFDLRDTEVESRLRPTSRPPIIEKTSRGSLREERAGKGETKKAMRGGRRTCSRDSGKAPALKCNSSNHNENQKLFKHWMFIIMTVLLDPAILHYYHQQRPTTGPIRHLLKRRR